MKTDCINNRHYTDGQFSELVFNFWEIITPKHMNQHETSLPDGLINFVFTFNPITRENQNYPINGYLIGPRSKANHYEFKNEATHSFGFSIKPTSFKKFSKIPLSELKNEFIPIEEILPRFKSLPQMLIEMNTFKERIDQSKKVVLSAIVNYSTTTNDRLIREFNHYEPFPVFDLSRKLNCSEKTISRWFNSNLGITPVEYSRILKLNEFIQFSLSDELTLTDITYMLRYFDQSHFIKDFRKVTDVNPSQYLANPSFLRNIHSDQASKIKSYLNSN